MKTSSVAVGSQRPVRSHLPVGAETSAALDAVDLAAEAGLVLDEWQRWFLTESLRVDDDDRWSAFEVALLVARQNGKGALLEARQLAGLFVLAEPLQVHTAHEFKTAYEHFLRIVNLVEGHPDLDRRVQRIRRGAGEQAIELKTGQRLRFLARSTGSGRGLTGDVVYLDEAFALTPAMIGALLPTLSAVPNPQVWYTSSAPRRESEVLHSIRKRGSDGATQRLLYAEWGLDAGADPGDVANWYAANPALGIRIDEEFVRAEFEAMRDMPGEFARERLGIPEELLTEQSNIPTWVDLEDSGSSIVSGHRFALDVSPDRKWACFAVAGRRADGRLHVEITGADGTLDHRRGTGWVVARGVELSTRWDQPIRVEKGSPAAAFVSLLVEAGAKVDEVTAADHADGLGLLLSACDNDGLRHLGQQALASAVKAAVPRYSPGGAVSWARRSSKSDITPLVATTLAVGAVAAEQVLQPLGAWV